jgi:hypothetical protein
MSNFYSWYIRLSLGKRIIIITFILWLLQAIPKWGFVLFGDGEVAKNIMTIFITPKSEL